MNKKTKALLREELMVAGPIAGVCIVVGAFWLLRLRFSRESFDSHEAWMVFHDLILKVLTGVSLLAAILLVLATENSGHLRGGFPRRLLRLPVETWRVVAVVLLARLCAVLCVVTSMTLLCRILYGTGLGPGLILLFAGLYVFIQVADWVRSVAALPAFVFAGATLFMLFVWSEEAGSVFSFLASGEKSAAWFPGLFAGELVFAYGISLLIVSWERRGGSFSLRLPLKRGGRVSMAGHTKPFTSPVAAQRWFERRSAGYFFPGMLLLAWGFLLTVCWIRYVYSRGSENAIADFLAPFWVFEVFPFLGLLFAAFAWKLRTQSSRRGRPGSFLMRIPRGGAQAAKDHVIAAVSELVPSWAVVTAVSIASFLLADHGANWVVIRDAYQQGELGIREITGILLGWSLFAGMAAWLLMNWKLPSGAWKACLLMPFLAFLAEEKVFARNGPLSLETSFMYFLESLGLALPMLIAGLNLFYLWYGWHKGKFSTGAAFRVFLLWGGASILLFPHTMTTGGDVRAGFIALLVSTALGAMLTLPWVMSAWRFATGSTLPASQRREDEAAVPLSFRRIARYGTAVLLLAVPLWLRWPQTPTWVTTWRAQGLPTNLEELNASYSPVPPSENLAELYTEIDEHWHPSSGSGRGELYSMYLFRDIRQNHQLESVAPEFWQETKRYCDSNSECLSALHAAAHSGRTRSYYPFHFEPGREQRNPGMEHGYRFARLLGLEAVIAANDGESGRSVQSILDMFPMASSLKDIPLHDHQFSRGMILVTALESLEWTMCLTALDASELRAIQGELSRALPSMEQGYMLGRVMRGDEVLDFRNTLWSEFSFTNSTINWMAMLTPLLDLAALETRNRLVVHLGYERVRQKAKRAVLNGEVIRKELHSECFECGLLTQAPWPFGEVYIPEGGYNDEFYLRTRIGTARAAIAVELFRHAHGTLPQRLEELVPEYLDAVPPDFYCGKPVHYRIQENGGFVVYGCDEDGVDDGGNGDRHNGHSTADMTFTVRPPEIQARAQVR